MTPALIVQGERDAFGKPEEVAAYKLLPQVRLVWLADGDHSFRPRKSPRRTTQQNLAEAVAHVARFIAEIAG